MLELDFSVKSPPGGGVLGKNVTRFVLVSAHLIIIVVIASALRVTHPRGAVFSCNFRVRWPENFGSSGAGGLQACLHMFM